MATGTGSKAKKQKPRKISIRTKLMGATAIIIAAICVVMALLSYFTLKDRMTELAIEVAKISAQATSSEINGENLAGLSKGDEDTTYYKIIRSDLQKAMTTYNIKYMYTIYRKDGKLYYGVDGEKTDKAKIGDPYKSDSYSTLAATFEKGTVYSSGKIDHEDGDYLITAYAPVTNMRDEIVGVIGSDYNASSIVKSLFTSTMRIILVSALILVIALLAEAALVNTIIKNIDIVNEKLFSIVHNGGDLTQKLHITTGDETEIIANNVNDILSYIRSIMLNIANNSDSIKTASGNIATNLSGAEGAANDVSTTMEEMSSAMEESSASLSQINELMSKIKDSFNEMVGQIQNGRAFTEELRSNAEATGNKAADEQEKARAAVAEMASTVEKKIKKSKAVEKINVLTDNILNITKQTNLLSLNASIEAARAGEAGKGFAVVAGEIGSLASDSAQSAAEIQKVSAEVISAVNELADEARSMIEFINGPAMEGFKLLASTSDDNSKNAEAIDDMVSQLADLSSSVQENIESINEATNSVNIAVEESAQGVVKAAEKSIEMTKNMKSISSEASSSSQVSDSLYNEVNKFKLN